MRLLLARPPRRNLSDAGLSVPPLGLAYIASAARNEGIEVEIIDAYALRWTWDEFEQEIRRRKPEALGISTMTPVADVAARAIEIARPYTQKIVLGGPHPTAVQHAVLDDMPGLDAAVIGEGEETIVPLMRWWDAGEPGLPPEGVLVRNHPFTKRAPPSDLAKLARPARDLLPNQAYRYLFATRRGFSTMISSRGCPFRCSFCDRSVGGTRWRARPAEDVVNEMHELAHRYGVGFINFYDDNFTLHRKRVVDICEEILRTGLDMEWKCEGRVDSVDAELLTLMRRAGCRVVAYGVESANPETLALLRKDITVEQASGAFSATREAGIRSLAYMILGAPGEDADAVDRSIRFCRDLRADYVQFSTLSAMPGTPLFQTHAPSADVRNPVDGDERRPTITDLPADVLAAQVRKAWTGFYLRPRPMARLLRDAWASGSMDEAWRMGRALGRWTAA